MLSWKVDECQTLLGGGAPGLKEGTDINDPMKMKQAGP
jgi:hypothetical protein